MPICSFVLVCAALGAGFPDEMLEPPNVSEFLIIPLWLHVLTAEDAPEVDCKLTDEDLRRIVGKVNTIWHQAGIHWGLESIIREPAAGLGRFKTARDKDEGPLPLGIFRVLMPADSRATEGLNVYYIHKFSVNGVYLGDRVAFVQETARLREVEGGIDEPIPRVTAHELGHALGLPHRQDRTNLLASGTTGMSLDTEEVAKTRNFAKKMPGTLTIDELRKHTEDATDADRAKILKKWLDELPKK